MTAAADPVFHRLEEAALGAIDDYMAFRAYQGINPDYYKRARIGIPVLSTYGRVRGTRANERQLDLIERRIASGDILPLDATALADQSSQSVSQVSAGTKALPDSHHTNTARRAGRK